MGCAFVTAVQSALVHLLQEYGRAREWQAISALSRSFDKMADAVQEKIADLEADVQRREDFVGAFTHELKTPMTSIIGYADMLHTMQTDPDEQREAAAAIVHEGRHPPHLPELFKAAGREVCAADAHFRLWQRGRGKAAAAAVQLGL